MEIKKVVQSNLRGPQGPKGDTGSVTPEMIDILAQAESLALQNYTGKMRISDVITKKPWADVRAYGAIGDGITDDSIAVQIALESGGSVLIPYGYTFYCASVINVSANTLIFGTGEIKFASNKYLFIQGSNVTIQNITITGSNADRSTQLTNGYYAIFTDSTISVNNFKVIGATIQDFASGIIMGGIGNIIDSCVFNRIGNNIDGTFNFGWGNCVSTGYHSISGKTAVIKNNKSYDCAGFSSLSSDLMVIIENNYSDRASYITCGQQLVSNLKILNNHFIDAYDNAIDCQQCSNTIIQGNSLINPGRSTLSSTGDRKAIFWGTDGDSTTIKSNCNIIGNIVKIPDGDGTKGGFNITSAGGENINITGNTFENVLCVFNSTITSITTGNTFKNCQINCNGGRGSLIANQLINTYVYVDSGVSRGNISNNIMRGFYSTKDHVIYLTGVSSGLSRYSINGNQLTTSHPREDGYYMIDMLSTAIHSLSVTNNRTDSRWLIKNCLTNLPSYYEGNLSEVVSGNSDTATKAEVTDLVYYTGLVAGTDTILMSCYNKFFQKTRDFAVVLFGSSTSSVGTYRATCFDGGSSTYKIMLTNLSKSAGTTLDFTCTLNATTYNIEIVATGTNGATAKFLIYLL